MEFYCSGQTYLSQYQYESSTKPGSSSVNQEVAFPFYNHNETVLWINSEKVMFIVRAADQSHLFLSTYPQGVLCGQSQSAGSVSIQQSTATGLSPIIVDDMNITSADYQECLCHAYTNDYLVIMVEDVSASCQQVLLPAVPLYFGLFMGVGDTAALLNLSAQFVAELLADVNILKTFSQECGEPAGIEIWSRIFSKPRSRGHVTMMFCGVKPADVVNNYVKNIMEQSIYGSIHEVEVVGFHLTPRTLGAKVALPSNLVDNNVWACNDGNHKPGSGAHITLSTSPGVSPMLTGIDQLTIMDHSVGDVHQSSLGPVFMYPGGLFYLHLPQPWKIKVLFTGHYY